jgi:membrane-associated phospholipid phosphatase
MQKFTEFQGRTGALAWALLSAMAITAFLWLNIAQPFRLDTSVFHSIGTIYAGMIFFMVAFATLKGKVDGSDKVVDVVLFRVLSGMQLFFAAYFFLLTYAISTSVIVYLGQTLNAPLQDEAFAAADAALGFNFLSFHSWVGTQPLLPEAMFYAYNSGAKQFLIIFLVSAIFLDRENVAQFCSLLALTIIPTVIIASLWPALGSCIHHQPTAQPFAHLDPNACKDYLPHVLALRDGTFEVFRLPETKGLLTFPSYHTVMAIIAVYAVRNYIWLLVPFALLNTVNILSTMPFGGHYLVDVLAGAVIAVSAIAIVRWNAARATKPVASAMMPQPITA